MSYQRMITRETTLEREIAALREQVDAVLADAEATDAAEDQAFGADRRGDQLPEELRRRETRLARIREAKEALESEAAAAEQGKTPRRRPGGRDPFAPKPTALRNFTDAESRIMKTSDGAFQQCYNGQAIVDSATQVIVAAELSDEAPEARLLEASLDQLTDNLDAIDAQLPAGAVLLGDAGYFSDQNVVITAEHGLDAHLASGRFKHSEPPARSPRGAIPKHATPKQLIARKLRRKQGAALYARRKTIVEPVFGQLQTVQDARQLLLRGRDPARAQWRFHCAIHNLLKLHRNGGLALITTT